LIPKNQYGDTFNDFRLISYCNVIYKLISKVIAKFLKPFLDMVIEEEQFIFLKNRQIQDTIAVSQEILHMVKKIL
jgi:predicted transcriptional regulator